MKSTQLLCDTTLIHHPKPRPRLLVSVRDAEEAAVAIAGGADLVDVKEPLNGPLGAADPQRLMEIVRQFSSQSILSAALGELADWKSNRFNLPEGFRFAKFGLAGCARIAWQPILESAFSEFGPEVSRVAVVYADWRSCDAPEPETVIDVARQIGAAVVLFDTFTKNGASLFDCLNAEQIGAFQDTIRSAGMLSALAGSLNGASLAKAVELAPDYVAVRGAVCSPDRKGRICAEQVLSVKATISGLLKGPILG